MLFTRKRDERQELTGHLLRLRTLISRGGVGVEFKPSVTQPRDEPPRWLAMLRASEGASGASRLGRISFTFYRSDEAPTPHDLLHVLDELLDACYLGTPGRFFVEPSRVHIDIRDRKSSDRVSADLMLRRV